MPLPSHVYFMTLWWIFMEWPTSIIACSAGVFSVGESCLLCSYCCNHHLWFYDGGRLGRVKIVTLRVGARAKKGKEGGEGTKKCFLFSLSTPSHTSFDLSHFLLSFESSNMAFSQAKTFAHPKKMPALQATSIKQPITSTPRMIT